MTRPIFVVGCPRSGTTLLRDLLCSHPRLTFPGESHFIPRFYRAWGDPCSDEEAWRLARRILHNPWVAPWGITAAKQDFAGCRSFSAVTRRLFEMWAATQGKPRWGDKTPHYVRDISLLLQLFPEAQVIHIIRDGRDAALSWLATPFEPRNLYVAARMWKEMVTRGRRDGALLPAGAYLELCYETLLAAPEASMRGVCEFLGEPYHAAVLSPSRIAVGMWGRPSSRTAKPAFAGAIVRGNTGKWRSGMSLRQRVLFESVAGDLLDELGYPVEGLARILSPGEKVLWEADHWLRFMARILRRLLRPRHRRAALAVGWAMLRRFLRRPPSAASDGEGAAR